MKKGIFIIGTDTGVGKTVIAAGLTLVLRAKKRRVGVMKPVATGCFSRGQELVSSDTLFLLEAGGEDTNRETVNPIRFRNPLAPLAAARAEGRSIDTSQILRAYEELHEHFDFVIVEGIGGLMVPFTESYFVSDLIREFQLPVLIVSRTKLGTINHTLLTIEAAKSRGLNVAGIIFNNFRESDLGLDEQTSPKIISDLSRVPVLGMVPHIPKLDVENLQFGNLKQVIEECVNIDAIVE
ncbi:MAG: dethiobiotin synthase [Candidatus Omnitrophica bacterium]|nr:dethiobiotin synthase [Candidatus Omnitrophota bacterium]